ncbi:MAG: hypothetical protein D6732_16660 [Methanobacteriota archaeon]|nr:MAG: hypothetical protein D6732_16660 [Euryarchaeota archaeon]
MKLFRLAFSLTILQEMVPVLGATDPVIIRSGINGAVPIAALAFLGFVLPRLMKRDQERDG